MKYQKIPGCNSKRKLQQKKSNWKILLIHVFISLYLAKKRRTSQPLLLILIQSSQCSNIYMYFCMLYVEKCHMHNFGLNRIRRSTIYKKWIDKSSEIFHKIKVVYRYIFMYAVDVHFGILCVLWKLCMHSKSLRAHTQIHTHKHTHTLPTWRKSL